MRITGEHRFRATRVEVWQALQDPVTLRASLPGARRLEPTGPDAYDLSVDVGVGSVKGTYDGSFALADKVEQESCTVRATAAGRPGTVSAVARMRLADAEGGAHLAYEADATVTGPLAGVGQRLMGAAARRTTEQFLAALDEQIAAPAAAPEPAPAAVPAERPAPRARRADPVLLLVGAAVALAGVAVGRWTTRR